MADLEAHDAQVAIIRDSVAALLPNFAPHGMQPQAIIEGAIRGAALVAIASGATAGEYAQILEDMAFGFRNLDAPKLQLVVNNDGRQR